MKKALVSIFLTAILGIATVSAQLVHIPLNQRIAESQVVVEGIVVSKTSFWDAAHHNIYTSNVIEVYKVFKGETVGARIELITVGGTVGEFRDEVSHSLQVNIGDVGIFTLKPSSTTKDDPAINAGLASFKPTAGPQGLIKYDLATGKAADVFSNYKDIQTEVYPAITSRTNKKYTVIKEVDLYKN